MSPKCDPKGPMDAARTWLDEFGRVTLATVVSTWGSSPVPVGGPLVVAPGDRFEGSVSGGCVEAEVIAVGARLFTLQNTGHFSAVENPKEVASIILS